MQQPHIPKFEIGQVFKHRRYAYRGVIVGIDLKCAADDAWYQSNATQPRRDQPWYNVLDEDGRERYVAEENMAPDRSGEALDNPLITSLFPTFVNGRYYRQGRN